MFNSCSSHRCRSPFAPGWLPQICTSWVKAIRHLHPGQRRVQPNGTVEDFTSSTVTRVIRLDPTRSQFLLSYENYFAPGGLATVAHFYNRWTFIEIVNVRPRER